MPDDQEINGTNSQPGANPDPLGIIGWEVAGKYKIRAYIGGGGFGEVYEGFNKNLPEQRLVFKFFKRVQSRDKFAKEAKILCMLDHPNISRVMDYLPEEGAVVVTFIDGEDGSVILKNTGALDGDRFIKVARAMTSAIAFAHEKRIAHRDIKPGNIMFDKSGHVYLIDFGIAKEMGGDATKTAYVALTPLFAAPERQSGDQNYNPFLSDIYEMGVTLFNFATNDLPYRNPSNPNYREWGGMASENLSPDLRRILMKATHPDPKQRYQTSKEMGADVKKLKKAYGGKKKKPLFSYLAVIVVVLAVAGFLGRDQITGLYQQLTARQEQTGDSEQLKADIEEILGDDVGDTTVVSGTDSAAVADVPAVDETVTEEKQEKAEIKQEETKPVTEVETEEKKPPVSKKEKETEPVAEKKDEIKEPPIEETKSVVVVPEEKEEEKVIEEVKKEPPPPSEFALTFDIKPPGASIIYLNGREGKVDSTYTVKPGGFNVSVVHPEYPIYTENISVVDSDRKVSIDLSREMPRLDSVSMQISLNPPSDQHIIELSFNGRRHTLLEFPVWSMMKPQGEWLVEAGIIGISKDESKNPIIDSVVVYPYGGGRHAAIKGTKGKIILGSSAGEQVESVPLLIFWSE